MKKMDVSYIYMFHLIKENGILSKTLEGCNTKNNDFFYHLLVGLL